jgi:gliding motility-associated-like protein
MINSENNSHHSQVVKILVLLFAGYTTAFAQPTIVSFTPTSGPIGTTVTITGANFSTTPANNIVYFGATRVTVTAATATQLTVTVPTGATYQPITVQVNGLTGYSSKPFVVTFAGGGTIDACSFAPKVLIGTLSPGDQHWSAIHDMDGDGKIDLIVPDFDNSRISVYRNISTGTINSGSFAPRVDFTTAAQPNSVAVGDIDGDGKPDLVVGSYSGNVISVLRNISTSGTIAFATKVDVSVGSFLTDCRIHDIDGDGKPEILISSFSFGLRVLRNTSTVGVIDASSFASAVTFAAGSNPFRFDIGDLDGDNKPDVAVPDANANAVSVLRNISSAGTISFESQVVLTTAAGSPPAGQGSIFSLIGDVDTDGKLDLAVVNYTQDVVSIFRNTGSPGTLSFDTPVDFGSSDISPSPALSDLDGDGKIDLTYGGSSGISVMKNNSTPGSISFAGKIDFSSTYTHTVGVADINGDGRNDLVTHLYDVAVFENVVGTISPPTITSFTPSSGPIGTSVTITGTNFSTPFSNTIEFNGVPATITASTATTLTVTVPASATTGLIEVTIGCNTVTSGSNFMVGVFIPTIASFTPGSGPIGTSVIITGTNFDATPANNTVYFGATRATVTAATSTQLTVTVPTGATYQPITVQVTGLTGSSKDPFITTFTGGGTITACSFLPPLTIRTNPVIGPIAATLVDLDGDEKIEIVNCDEGNDRISITRNISTPGALNGSSFESEVTFATGDRPVSVAFGDLDGDGKLDLVVSNFNNGFLSIFKNLSSAGTIAFASRVDISVPTFSPDAAIADIDLDGKLDIVISSQGTNQIFVLRNIGTTGVINTGSFTAGISFATGDNPFRISLGDIDGDGKVDAVVPNISTYSVSILRNTSTPGSVSFASQVVLTTAAGSPPPGFGTGYAALGDIDGDGVSDLIVNNLTVNTISLYRNTSTTGTISFDPKFDVSVPLNGIAHANDIDGDGKVDLIMELNYSSVSIYKNTASPGIINAATLASPVTFPTTPGGLITLGDIDGDGKTDVVTNVGTVSILRNVIGEISPPTITSFTPSFGSAGTSVTITGTNFSTPFTNTVEFNGVPATITASTATTITVDVPTGATTGLIEVTIGCNTINSSTNFVVCSPHSAPTGINNSGCSGASILLGASGGSPGLYRWYTVATGGTAIPGEVNDSFTTPTLTSSTSYWVTITDGPCESTLTEVIATVIPLPTAPGVQPMSPVCPASNVILTATGGTDGQYRWYDGGTLIGAEVNSTLAVTNLTSTKTYQIALHNGTCESNRTSITITIKNCTPPVIAPSTTTAFIEGTVIIDVCALLSDQENDLDLGTLQATGTLISGAPFTLTNCTLSVNYAGIPFPETDVLTIRVCDLTGLCTDQSVSIEFTGDIEVFNALSPNGDGRNDTFYINYINILPATRNNRIQIYNRWGDLVWETENYDNTERVFTGLTTSGKELPSGTYYYKLTTASKSKTGFISLKR